MVVITAKNYAVIAVFKQFYVQVHAGAGPCLPGIPAGPEIR
jgi:hypothetical protein